MQPARPDLTPAQRAAAEAAQAEREQQLREQKDWALSGRIAVSSQGRGGSGRIEWQQSGPRYQVSLSAPITRQSWRLSGDAHGALLEGLEGGPRRGTDARTLLLRETGWDIPVVALAEWVRGARAQALGPARIEYRADGLPWLIEQGGWRIEYEWPDQAGSAGPAAPPLPERLEARALGHDATVKLIVDEWGTPVAAAGS
jgi:outer membrane lipoprotein LolB